MASTSTDHSHCCVPQFVSDARYGPERQLSFHTFPKDKEAKSVWINKIRRDPGCHFKITAKAKVCSKHFKKDLIRKTPNGKRLLMKNAVPTFFEWNNFLEPTNRRPPLVRGNLNGNCDNHAKEDGVQPVLPPVDNFHDYHLGNDVIPLEEKLRKAEEHISKLEATISHLETYKFGTSSLKSSPNEIKFYSGFENYDMLKVTFEALQPTAEKMVFWSQYQRNKGCVKKFKDTSFKSKIPLFEQFFLFTCFLKDLLKPLKVSYDLPPFLTSNRAQFEVAEVQETQNIARARIHVERAIRRIKENHIFDRIIPLNMAGTVNQLWTVSFLLSNFKGPLF
eukprot:gene283-9933_t